MIGQILFVTLYNNQVAHLNRHGEYCHGHCILASRAAWAAAGALDTVTVTLGGTQFKFQLVSVPLLKSSNFLTAQVAAHLVRAAFDSLPCNTGRRAAGFRRSRE